MTDFIYLTLMRAVLAALAFALGFGSGNAQAFDPAASARAFVEARGEDPRARYEIELGDAPARLRAAPCAEPRPYLPSGARAWGASMLGWRCAGAQWNLVLPVRIRVYAAALVAARPLAADEMPAAQDLRSREIELTREAPGVLRSLDEVAGRVVARPVAAGSVLRHDQFKAPQVIGYGEQVKVVYAGEGFSISTSGRSLQAGAAGQPVRVQLESGRVLSGIARADRRVEVRF